MGLSTFDHTWARSGRWACAVANPPELPDHAAEVDVVDACVAFERVATPARATLAYATALERWPRNLTLEMGRGNSLYAAGRKEEAALAFERAAVAHASAAAWINYGEVALELGRPGRAAEAARRAEAAGGAFSEKAAELMRRATPAAH
jgi:Tfp pilus assembly protein PilF